MNFIRTIYNKIKQSYDTYWTDLEEQMKTLSVDERMALYDSMQLNKY